MRAWMGLAAVVLVACPPGPVETTLDASTPGNSCDTSIWLDLPTDGGTLVVTGDGQGFSDHASCRWAHSESRREGGVGPDVVYRIRAPSPLVLEATIDGGTLDLGSWDCQLDCSDYALLPPRVGRPVERPSLRVAIPAGVHTLFAEAAAAYAMELRTHPLVPGETCDDPLVVSADAGAVSLELGRYFDESWPAAPLGCSFAVCSASAYVAFDTAEWVGVRAQVVREDTRLQVRVGTACSDPAASLEYQPVVLGPGRHFVGVRAEQVSVYGLSSTAAQLSLDVQQLIKGDRCEAPRALTLQATTPGTESAVVTGDTTAAFPTPGQVCGRTSNDVFFSFTLAGPSDLRAEVTTTASTFQPVLALLTGCSGAEAACITAAVPGAGATVTATALPAGTYLLSVNGVGATAGPYRLQVDVTSR